MGIKLYNLKTTGTSQISAVAGTLAVALVISDTLCQQYSVGSCMWTFYLCSSGIIPWNGFIVECDELLTICYKNPYNTKSS